jgi:putative ABC transport system permease protein
MRALLQDLRYGARIILKQPGYSILIALTLALAIGANSVIFSFANVLVLRPLPLKDQDTLGWILMTDPQRGGERGLVSIPDLLDYRASLTSFESISGGTEGAYTMTGRGDAMSLAAMRCTANLHRTWGLKLLHGRTFAEGEDLPGAAPVVVLSHQFWTRQFNSDPAIVGQALTLNGTPHTIVGVLRPEIEIGNLSVMDIWVPLSVDPSLPRDRRTLRVQARLKTGASFEQAAVEVRDVSKRLQNDHPTTNSGWEARLVPSKEAMTGPNTWVILGLLVTVVGFVLMIACANIANLVLARGTSRRRELAVRAAIGATRWRLVRQLLSESLLLGIAGGVLGLAVAHAGLSLIRAAAYEPFFRLVVIDRTVLLFTAALALLTPVIFSLLPALHASRPDVHETLKDNSARAGGSVRGRRSRSALVVAQVSLAMALLIVSGLLVRTMIEINRMPLGFDRTNMLTIWIELPEWRYTSPAAIADFHERVLARLGSLPGVQHVATTDRLPVLGDETPTSLKIDGHTPSQRQDQPWAVPVNISEDFFATAGISFIAGRSFTTADNPDSMRVAIVNAEMAKRYWGGAEKALGGRLQIEGESRWLTVVGIAGDVMRSGADDVNPQVYVSARQNPRPTTVVMMRAAHAGALMESARGELRGLDRDVPVREIRTIEEAFADETSDTKILIGMFMSFAVLALTLAASGLYGVVSYSVSQRQQEIGIRMALGAMASDIRRLIVHQTVVLVVIGGALGLAGGALLARASASVLFRVSPSDPMTYSVVAVLLTVVALVAAFVPVRRAVAVDPLVALRTE